jgi:hypothetical protein
MMVTKQEPFNAERLLLSTGITNNWCESNWTDSKHSDVGRVSPPAILLSTEHTFVLKCCAILTSGHGYQRFS